MKKKKSLESLLNKEKEHLKTLQQIVTNTIAEEELIIHNLLNPPKELLSRGQQISDKVARFGGSWKFIIVFCIVLLLWVAVNTLPFLGVSFDPFPYIFMNLILSCIAALQAPIIMMSQNRQEEKDRMRSENDYLINLKAEMEIRSLHQKMDLLLQEQIKTLYDTQLVQFEMLKELDSKLDRLLKQNDNNKGNSPKI